MRRLIVLALVVCVALSAFAFDLHTSAGITQAVSRWHKITFGNNIQSDDAQYIANMILYASNKYKVDSEVVFGVMAVESSFNASATNHNSIGIMQVKPQTAEFVTYKYGILRGNLTSIWYNIMCGVAYLHYLYSINDNMHFAITHYYGGKNMEGYYHKVLRAIKLAKGWKK